MKCPQKNNWRGLACFVFIALFFGIAGCHFVEGDSLSEIERAGKLILITDNNSNCYYLYNNKPMGFEYDLAKAFADGLGVSIEVICPGWQDMFQTLYNGRGNFIAASMTVTPARKKLVDFSKEYLSIQQYVIIHKDNHTVKSIEDLNGKKVHVRDKTSYQERLLELKKNGMDIELVVCENVPTEELIRQVAEKEIEITAADTNIALLNRRYYPDIRTAFPITEKQSLGWAVKKGDQKLLHKINGFFDTIKKDKTFAKIYDRYYANVEIFDYVDLKKFHKRTLTRLPKYEQLIKEESNRYGFDWRLIAAVVYQESHFDPWAKSYRGVRGLMQLTLTTADELGITNRLDPKQSIVGGVSYLNKMYERFEKVKGLDRMSYALASYNIGYGHVRDAQKIARQKGLDPHKWQALKQTLPLLRYRKYYKNTTYGYARGTGAVRYVDRIFTFYDILRRKSVNS